MLTMAVGHSDDVDPRRAVAEAIEACRSGLNGAQAKGGLLFAAFDSFDPAALRDVREAFPGIQLLGTTSAAEVSSVGGYREDSVVLSVFASDSVDLTVGVSDGLDGDVEAACAVAVRQAMAGTEQQPKLAILLAESFVADPQRTVDAVTAALPKGVVIVGGSSARRDFVHVSVTYQFTSDRVVENGLGLMLLSGPVSFATAVGTGWKAIGTQGTVTRSGAGAIHEIDGRPAVDFVRRYLDGVGFSSYGNPLAIIEPGAAESYLRAVQAESDSGSIFLAGTIPPGSRVQLTTAGTDEILDGTRQALADAMATFPDDATPEAALIFSCAIRKYLLGSRTEVEARLAREALGSELPVAGLYCFGEMGPVKGTPTSRYLNETFVTLLLGT